MYRVKQTNEPLALCCNCKESIVEGKKLGFGDGLYYRSANSADIWTHVIPDNESDETSIVVGQNCESCGDYINPEDI